MALASFAASGEPLKHGYAWLALELHNHARAEVKLPALQWNLQLAEEADEWARKLAREGRIYHSEYDARSNTGENIWMGTSGYYSLEDMIGGFLSEQSMFKPGRFPEISLTNKWEDVGHYSQIIWPQTEYVGCGLASGEKYDVLVCRYWPAGNVVGLDVG